MACPAGWAARRGARLPDIRAAPRRSRLHSPAMPISDFVRQLRQKIGRDLLMLPGVTAIVVNDEGEVLLNLRSDSKKWSILGGIPDPGEEPADAVEREVYEETGVRVRAERIYGVYVTPVTHYPNGDSAVYVTTGFVCRPLSGTPHVADDESLDCRYFAPNDLPPTLSADHRRQIADATSGPGPARFRRGGDRL